MKLRFCMACGGRLKPVLDDGRRRLRCRRCRWTFYGTPVPAAVALIVRGRKVLLVRRASPPYAGTWDLPGGFLEGEETPEVALRRELKEELEVETRSARFLAFFHDIYGPAGFPVLAVLYRVTVAKGPLATATDVSELRWFDRAALPWRQIRFRSVRDALRRFAALPRADGAGNGADALISRSGGMAPGRSPSA
jgi:ADP-ribose pyrophosphatase YjhB (NUDIX family)